MKTVGIVMREYDQFVLNKELCNVMEEENIQVLGIVPLHHWKETIALCDGIILPGGKDYQLKDLEIVSYLWEQDIPTLGICLGMQVMSMFFQGQMNTFEKNKHDSKEKYVHDVYLNTNSKLYDIIGKEKIKVNSRHHDYIKHTNLKVSAISSDGIIEAVEDREKKFFLGVQWHPESIMDENSQKLFHYFIQCL